MNWDEKLYKSNEKPLDSLVSGYSHTSVFRTIAFVGDSMSSGEFETRDADGGKGYHDFYEYSWGQHIARKNGLTAYNFSFGGMDTEMFDRYATRKKLWEGEFKAQAYVIALGVNDLYNGSFDDFGSVDDVDVNDYRNNKPTFMGNYAKIISRFKEAVPDAKFFLVTFPNETDKQVWQKETMAKGMYELAELFDNCYVIDLYKYGPVYDAEFKKNYFFNSHMSPAGYLMTAKLVDSYIDYIIRHNPEDFKTAGLIGTGIEY
jgi:hypothetical protein